MHKRLSALLFSYLMVAFLVACSSGGGGTTNKVTGISIQGAPVAEVALGSSFSLTANVTTEGSASKAVSWSASPEAAVSFDNASANPVQVTANQAAEVTITVTSTADSSKTDSVTVTLIEAPATTASLTGLVVDESFEALANARVDVFADETLFAQTTSGADGAFALTLDLADATAERSMVVRIEASEAGFSPKSQAVTVRAGGELFIEAVLPQQQALVIQQLEGFTFATTPDRSVVLVLPNDFANDQGITAHNIVGGSARAYSSEAGAGIRPSSPGFNMTGGFVSVDVTSNAAGALQPAQGNGSLAQLRWKLFPSDYHTIQGDDQFAADDRPDRIDVPVASFDEEAGEWVQESFGWLEGVQGVIPESELANIQSGTYEGDIYIVADVSHFSWHSYTYDDPPMTCINFDADFEALGFLPPSNLTFNYSVWSGSYQAGSDPIARYVGRRIVSGSTQGIKIARSERDAADDWNGNGIVDQFRLKIYASQSEPHLKKLFDDYLVPSTDLSEGCVDLGAAAEEPDPEPELVTVTVNLVDQDDNPLLINPADLTVSLKDESVSVATHHALCDTLPSSSCPISIDIGVARLTIPMSHGGSASGSLSYASEAAADGSEATGSASFTVTRNPEDASALSTTVTIPVTKNIAPTLNILSPTEGQVFTIGDDVIINAEAIPFGETEPSIFAHFLITYPNSLGEVESVSVPALALPITRQAVLAGDYPIYVGTYDLFGNLAIGRVNVTIVEATSNEAPTAVLVATPETGSEPLEVSFDLSGSSDSDGTITSFSLDFGNGDEALTGTDLSVIQTYTYDAAGVYTPTLTVTDNDGATGTDSTSINVMQNIDTEPSIISFTATPISGIVPLEVLFEVLAEDADGDALTIEVNFGDGQTATGSTLTHSYETPGLYTPEVTVSDEDGNVLAQELDSAITVNPNTPPVITAFTISDNPQAGLETTFSAEASDADGHVLSYSFDFGDSNTGEGQSVTHSYAMGGHYTVTLSVTDGFGGVATETKDIAVASATGNLPPSVELNEPVLLSTDTGGKAHAEYQFDAFASDPEDDFVTLMWDFGDGPVSGDEIETHIFETPGQHVVTVTVSDGELSGTDQVTVNVLPPTFSGTFSWSVEPHPLLGDASSTTRASGSIMVDNEIFVDDLNAAVNNATFDVSALTGGMASCDSGCPEVVAGGLAKVTINLPTLPEGSFSPDASGMILTKKSFADISQDADVQLIAVHSSGLNQIIGFWNPVISDSGIIGEIVLVTMTPDLP